METNIQEKKYDRLPLEISGLGGWLILVQIGLYLTIVVILGQLFLYSFPIFGSETWELLTSPESEYYHPLWAPMIVFETVYNIAFVLFCGLILFHFYGKRKIVPRLMIIFYGASLAIGIVDLILMYQIPALLEMEDGSSLRDTIRSAIVCAVWIPYFIKSRRVRNTFIR
ncbi:hypothetical protein PAE9249_02274 [Paenibacillus sp. CECT 9249]|uniref:DUF2569 domain-containing protein n=1 Tax=Paenibacillus sp. CECT 9249 TaxID=2845385 RepID=UPI001E4A9C0F|nr:DUF2569 domain-containing protein [Paenibacillus sp. CECT 9249]CAH0119766.1 hypothetical protein PAE9249_02274 [Paenibacillus sp. CECT 9249]